MPELPEVEVVRRGIDRWATERVIAGVDVLYPRSIRRSAGGAGALRAVLAGDSFRCASRRGKYLWLPLARSEGAALVVHLGMSGQVLGGYLMPYQPLPVLAPDANPGWASLAKSAEAIRAEIEASDADLLLACC